MSFLRYVLYIKSEKEGFMISQTVPRITVIRQPY